MLTSLLLAAIAIVSVFGWWRAMVHWQRAIERERLLLKLVQKLILYLPSIIEADDMHEISSKTRH